LIDFAVQRLVLNFENILNEIVAKLVLDEPSNLVYDDLRQHELLLQKTLLQAALHDAAALLVGTNFNGPLHARVVNEVRKLTKAFSSHRILVLRLIGGFKPDNKCLYHVVPVHVCAECQSLRAQLIDDSEQLLMHRALLSDALE
jgi:hypothetical protein